MTLQRNTPRKQRSSMEGTFLRTLVNTLPDLIWLKDENGVYLACNRRFEQFFGDKEAAILGKTDYDFVDSAQADFFRELDRKAMSAAAPSINEEWLTFTEGGYRGLFETIKTPMRDSNGKMLGILGIARDITERERAKAEVLASSEKLQKLYEMSPIGIALTDMQGRYIEFNDAFHRICGYTEEELNGLDYWTLTPREYEEQEAEQLELLKTKGLYGPYEKAYIRKDGSRIPLRLNGVLIHDRLGQPFIWSIVEDITEQRQAEETLRTTAGVFESALEGIVITDADNRIVEVNPAFSDITGYSRDEVMGRDPSLFSAGKQGHAFYAEMWETLNHKRTWRGEVWNRRKNGEIYAELLSISAICDSADKVQRYVGVFSDITHLKEHEAELDRVANYDALTGVPNRRLLFERLHQAITMAQSNHDLLAVCYLDLDGFKEINDRHGHNGGDLLLVEVARRMQEELRAGDTLARLGGDEFVLLLGDLECEQECFRILNNILRVVTMPFEMDNLQVVVSASIGVALYPLNDVDGDTLLRQADQAMYTAKQDGKNQYHLYDSAEYQRLRLINESRERIRHGLLANEFELYYQPKLQLSSHCIVGAEALIRWNHPDLGLLQPDEFLPDTNGSTVEVEVGEWVLESALTQLEAWIREGLELEISINVSAHHLQSSTYVADLEASLMNHPSVPPERIQIEVLETAALEDIAQSSGVISACRKIGVSFALDDFGTGYSSLMYLRDLDADTLKIDQSFVRGMATNKGDRAIVQGVIALAHTFGHQTVAEGVEDATLLDTLEKLGCDYAQGYCIAPPMTAAAFTTWYQQRKSGSE